MRQRRGHKYFSESFLPVAGGEKYYILPFKTF